MKAEAASERNQKCKDRIEEHLKGRLIDLRKLWENETQGIENDPDLGNFNEYGLCFDYIAPNTFSDQKQGYFRYQLSWGGPSDEFRFYLNPDFTPYSIEYAFLDWFDGATKELWDKDEELLFDIFSWFAGCLDLHQMVRDADA